MQIIERCCDVGRPSFDEAIVQVSRCFWKLYNADVLDAAACLQKRRPFPQTAIRQRRQVSHCFFSANLLFFYFF